MNEIIQKITSQIDSYYGTKEKPNHSIDYLIILQRRLACNSYYLASHLARLKADYNISYFTRKIEMSRSQQGFQKEMAIGKAKIEAEVQCASHLEIEVNAESDAFKCEVLLKQINKILSSIQQEISNLKEERKTSKVLT